MRRRRAACVPAAQCACDVLELIAAMIPLAMIIGATASAQHAAAAAAPGCLCPQWCDTALKPGQGRKPMPGGVITVAPGLAGGANCSTIQGAVDLTRYGYRDRYTIEIAPGTYREKLVVASNRPPITLVGMSAGKADGVLVLWTDCDGCASPTDPVGEWYDQTLWVGAADFRAHNISFAGGRGGGRNMAAQVAADRAYFRGCRFYGAGADTLYTGDMDHRAYFEDCFVNGTDDFLWGIGSAVFVRSTLVGTSTITAHKGTQVDRDGVLGGYTSH